MWRDLYLKFFKSGNPARLYIGLNVLLFFIPALLGVVFTLSGHPGWLNRQIQEYMAFPASLDQFPLRAYTVITYAFFHAGFFHLLFNMLWLFWIGQIFLDFLKPRQFHFVYLGGGITGALAFLILFHSVPVFSGHEATLIGASACVMAILSATATLVPDYSMRLLLIGELKLKYLIIAYVLLDLIGIDGTNAGGNVAHLGGALFGFLYIKFLQQGTDWSRFFKRKPTLKVVRPKSSETGRKPVAQKDIDAILDKISKSGYEQLSKEEKETLFKASKE